MDSLATAILRMTAVVAETAVAEHIALNAAAKKFLERAQAAIGTYEYGWEPLQEETIARKRTGDSPLLETGVMKESGSYEVHSGYAIVGFEDPKLLWHEFGTRNIPPRPVIGGTIDHHGREIADLIGVTFGKVLAAELIGGSRYAR